MALSLNEIKIRAQQFVLNWKDKVATAREEADAQTFENEFFASFGVPRCLSKYILSTLIHSMLSFPFL